MPRHPRWTATIGAALTLLAATGCAPVTVVGCGSPAEESTAPVPSTGPTYAGPPPGAPQSAHPPTRLLGEVQLAESAGEEYAQAVAVRPGGGAYVAMTDARAERSRLLTVAAAGDEYEITGWVDLPSGDVNDLLPLPQDRLVMIGRLTGGEPGYGFSVVDPATGNHEDAVVLPASPDAAAIGEAVLSPDGRTLYLHLHTFVGEEDGTFDLVAVDIATGAVVARRDLVEDLTDFTDFLPGAEVAAVLPRADGGVRLAVNARESFSCWDRSTAALLAYDAALEPDGGPVLLSAAREGFAVSGTSTGIDGTAFALLESGNAGRDARVVAVPDGGTPTPVARFGQEDDLWAGGLVVDPAQAWAVIPSLQGIRTVGLADDDADGATLTLDCLEGFDGDPESWHSDASPGVHWVVPNGDASTVLIVGECDTDGLPPQMLWIAGA